MKIIKVIFNFQFKRLKQYVEKYNKFLFRNSNKTSKMNTELTIILKSNIRHEITILKTFLNILQQ